MNKLIIFIQLLIGFGTIIIGSKSYQMSSFVNQTQKKLIPTMSIMNESGISMMVKKQYAFTMDPLPSGYIAPDFSLLDEHSKKVRLNDYRGQKVLLQFSSIDNENCEKLYPSLKRLKENNKDLVILMMQYESIPSQNLRHQQEEKLPFSMLSVTAEEIEAYHINTLPMSVLIDENGILINTDRRENLTDFVGLSKI
jgi:peroxiredoxin